jgi:CubicO group peptidase (beta-lactamase class C family)
MRGQAILLRFAALVPALCGLLPADRIDEIVRAEMDRQRLPGVSLGIIREGKLDSARVYGFANLEHHIAVKPETVFKIGSVSKQFIAAGILLLEQDGKLSLDDPVRKHLPDAPDSWNGITLRHILSHTAGLVRESPAFQPFRAQADIDLVRAGYAPALVFQPGEKWQYSNLGYFTAAEIIARASGTPWPQFLAERIFKPLGMSSTRTTTALELVPNRAAGYTWKEGRRNALEYLALRPSGALLSTVPDLAKWDAALYGDAPLNAATRAKMWTEVKLNSGEGSEYALGWFVSVRGGRRTVHHGGTLSGFRSHYARFPGERLSFVVLTNLDSANAQAILWRVAAEFLPGVDITAPRASGAK